MKTVYLAGPIGGLTSAQAHGWRNHMADRLFDMGIQGVSPLRCEPRYEGVYKQTGDPRDRCFGTSQAIFSKNRFDVTRCDLTLAYLPSASVGTIVEIAWAYAAGKPVIVVSANPALAEHPLIAGCASWNLRNMDEALDVISGVLGSYT